jgi:hypothetical protein
VIAEKRMNRNENSNYSNRRHIMNHMPFSGICPVCQDDCPGLCEIGTSSYRGWEALYPHPSGSVISSSIKKYPVEYSDLNIQGTCAGTLVDKTFFKNISTQTEIGTEHRIKLKLPVSTRDHGLNNTLGNLEGIAIGGAIAGIMVFLGENITGLDTHAEFKKGKLIKSPALSTIVKTFQKWHDSYGAIVLQLNNESRKNGTAEYAMNRLSVDALELSWGEEIKGSPSKGAGNGQGFDTAEYDSLMKQVDYLRNGGAKFISLKTGAFRIADLARAMRFASDAKIDLLTIIGAGGGKGSAPWRMLNEWGIPSIYLQSLAYKFAKELKTKGKYVPDLSIAGGFSLEDHIFKALSLGAPYFKSVCMGRALLIALTMGKNIEKWILNNRLPDEIKKYGSTLEAIFAGTEPLKSKYGKQFKEIPASALGIFTFCDRLHFGLRHLMAGARKHSVNQLDRSDLVALTEEAADVTGIPYVMKSDLIEAKNILFGKI